MLLESTTNRTELPKLPLSNGLSIFEYMSVELETL